MLRTAKKTQTASIISFLLLCNFLVVGCSLSPSINMVAPNPSTTWISSSPPPKPKPANTAAADDALLAQLLSSNHRFGLVELTDLALRNNPRTRAAWLQAKAAQADVAISRSAYLPNVTIGGEVSRVKRSPQREDDSSNTATNQSNSWRTDKGPFASIDYTLFDFGNREYKIDETKSALVQANYLHNAAVQAVILNIQQAYYQYISLRALLKTQEATLEEAKANADSAEDRRVHGLATVADVLQAKTALARAELEIESTRGRIQAVRGGVLTAVGLSPSAPIDVADIPLESITVNEGITNDVQKLLELAEDNNPRLLAARAQVERSHIHVDTVRTSALPTIGTNARVDRYYRDDRRDNDYVAGLEIKFPLFTGFRHSYELEKAKREAEIAESEYKNLTDEQFLAVWTDYFANKTAQKQIISADALYASANESLEVAKSRYREGVGTILDLLSAQAALELARSSQVKARSDWLLSLSQLRYDLGTLAVGESGSISNPKD